MATVVTVGRGQDLGPGYELTAEEWSRFQTDLDIMVSNRGLEVYFRGVGHGWSQEWGGEEAYTIIFEDLFGSLDYEEIVLELSALAWRYGQDAIAITSTYTCGSTKFVGPLAPVKEVK